MPLKNAMKKLEPRTRPLLLGMTLVALLAGASAMAVPTNVFFTRFELAEGYTTNAALIGQNGWTNAGSGGNGILTDFISGEGQQAYIGFAAPNPGDDQLEVWRPVNFDPLAAGLPLVKFSVLMNVVDSSNNNYDNFRWSVYNAQGNRLFALDFDNFYTNVSYRLDGTNTFIPTGVYFAPNSNYTLSVTMDFAANRWSATLGSALIATNQPITTVAAPLNLGDIDAAWLVYATNAPGNNYLLFDNYQITAEAFPMPPAQLQFLGRTGEGWALLRVSGQNGSRWALDATTNLVHWTALKTNTISGAYFDHVDTTAPGFPRRFYRTRLVP